MKKIIVFGAAGFIGKKLVAGLLDQGCAVTAVDKKWTDSILGADCISGNAFDPAFLDKVIVGHDVVYHLISTTTPSTSNKDPVFDCKSNVIGTLHILEAMVRHGVKKIIFTSSGGTVYGALSVSTFSEDCETSPICAYGISKLSIEKYLQLYSRLHGIQSVILRISNPYGPGQVPGTGQGVVATFVMKVLKGETIEVWGDGSVVRDFIYINDVIDAMIASASIGTGNLLLNIGSGTGLSINEVIEVISDLMPMPVVVNYLEARAVDVPAIILDIGRAKKLLQWKPEVSFVDGVRSVVKSLGATVI